MADIELNEFQTPFEQLHLDEVPDEVRGDFFEFINNVPFIKSLISKDRKRAKDLPRDEEGKIIVDLANPHILEDMDYFRPSALHFKKTGKYTDLRPNSNPNSQYMKWLKEEVRRCWYGYVRESDGEWVTGNMYFYLNYHMIEITDDSENMEDKQDSTNHRRKKLKGKRRTDFPDVWEGVYWRFHYIEQAMYGGMYDDFQGGKGGCEISSRGKSKSFSMAAMVDKYFTLGESEDVNRLVKSLVVAATKEYLDADGILNKFETACDFLIQRPELQFPKRRIKSSIKDLEWQMGYYDLNTGTKRGTLNQVLGVATKDDIGKIRGKRSQLIVVEEFGNFSNVLEMYNIMKPSWIEGDIAFGFIYMIGTSSEKEADFAGAAEIVYNPVGYRMYGLPNKWDIDGLGRKWITFFYPSYINYKGYYNHDGVSDVTASLLRILLNRFDVKYNTTDINSITREIAERPITPQEVLTRARNNFFPVSQLNERINQLDNTPGAYDDVYVGDLVINKEGNVDFVPTQQEPIRVFPLGSDERTAGALEIYEMPQKNQNGEIQSFRYICGIDPIDQDYSETVSLYSIFVMDMFTDRIVAEYTGRPTFANEAHELARKLCIFYNATACYESNLHGLYSYFQQHKCTHLLCDTPDYLKQRNLIKIQGYGNVNKGIRATAPINNYANQLIKDWLMTPVNMISEVDGVEQQITVPQLYTLKNRALLQELVRYNPKINVDRIRAFGMLMLYREQFVITYEGELDRSGSNDSYDASDPANDEFFTKNYHPKNAYAMKQWYQN